MLQSSLAADLMFLSDAAAQRAVCALGLRLAQYGIETMVSVADRSAAVVGTFNYYAVARDA